MMRRVTQLHGRSQKPSEAVNTVAASAEVFDQMQNVRRALAALGQEHREVLLLSAGLELSYEDIARALGIRVGTVRSRLSRARRRLRELLATDWAIQHICRIRPAKPCCGRAAQVSDELDEVRRYVDGIDLPHARTMAEVRLLGSTMAVSGLSSARADRTRRVHAVRWAFAIFVVLAVGVALLVPTLSHRTQNHGGRTHLRDRLAQLVVDDVDATVAVGNYDMTYSDTTTPPTKCPTTGTESTTTPCWMSSSPGLSSSRGMARSIPTPTPW